MKKELDTLVGDIYTYLEEIIEGKDQNLDRALLDTFGKNCADALERQLTPRTKERTAKTLYFSEIGKPCSRALWYNINGYEGSLLEPHTLIKFMFGDILEELLALLVQLAGHELTDSQKSCELELPNGWKLRGRMDYKIDGVVVDAKSASTYAFKKFRDGTLLTDDPFGYMSQLAYYVSHEHDYKGGFLAIDKSNGHITVFTPDPMDLASAIPDVEELVAALESPRPPERAFDDEAHGSSNRCLKMQCSYCNYKSECWSDSNGGVGLRTFLYKGHNGPRPVFMTQVGNEPKVMEITE